MIATEVVKEALREYVGDGDGADEEVLRQHNEAVAEAAVARYRRRERVFIIVMWATIAINATFATLNLLSGL